MKPEQNRLVENNLGLVHACARRYISRGEEYEDLFQSGCIGLIKAAAGYDPGRGTAFSTYAVPVILGEIRRIFRDSGCVKVSRRLRELGMHISKAQRTLEDTLGRPPLISELAEYLGEPCELISEAVCAAQRPLSLTAGEDEAQIDIPIDDQQNLIELLDLKTALDSLSTEEQTLINLRYRRGLTQAQTARIMGTSQVGISRKERKILAKLSLT